MTVKKLLRVAALLAGASLFTVGLGGCEFRAEVIESSKGNHTFCTDTRDGETFAFKAETIRNASIGYDSCFTVTTDDGLNRRLCRSHEAFIKCTTKTPNVKVSGLPQPDGG
jgi:hypothetical protein